MAKHTEGPWHFYAETNSTEPNWHHVANASRMRILANVHIEPGNQMDLANASLITAAPDLLAAAERGLQALTANGAPNCEAAKELRAAIARATA